MMITLNKDIETALESYLDAKNLDSKTKHKYLDYYRRLANVHGVLDQKTLDEFIKYNDNGITRSMLKHLIKAIVRWEVPQEIKVSASMLDIPKSTGKGEKKTPLHLDYNELVYLEEHLPIESIRDERNILSILTQWWCGIRESELLGITINSLETNSYNENKDKNFQRIKISSESAKYGKEGYAYVPTDLYKRIIKYIQKRASIDETFKINISNNKNIWGFGRTAYDKLVRKSTKNILGRAYNTHSLRHGRGTDLIKKGVPIEKVKEILRHADISSTQVYVHIANQDVENSLR